MHPGAGTIMKPTTSLVLLVLVAAASQVACSQPVGIAGAGSEAAITDLASVTARPDGQFDVVCKDGRKEIDTAEDIQANAVCVAVASSGPVVNADNARFTAPLPDSQILTTLDAPQAGGVGLFKGYVSFTTNPACSGTFDIQDGLGNHYSAPCATTQSFARLPVPVVISVPGTFYYYDASFVRHAGYVELDSTQYEILAFNPQAFQGVTGKADVSSTLAAVGPELGGVSLQIQASAKFLANFTNGAACDHIDLRGRDGAKLSLTAAAPSVTGTLVAPIWVQSNPACIGARLGMPENANTDFFFSLDKVALPK
jgi:hypothetical protein